MAQTGKAYLIADIHDTYVADLQKIGGISKPLLVDIVGRIHTHVLGENPAYMGLAEWNGAV